MIRVYCLVTRYQTAKFQISITVDQVNYRIHPQWYNRNRTRQQPISNNNNKNGYLVRRY
jgi:hypothetical protein